MSIATGRPPYTDEDLDKIANALVVRAGWGTFFATPEAALAFKTPLERMTGDERVKMVEDGAVFLFGFGDSLAPEEVPEFTRIIWLGAEDTRTVLSRVVLRESLLGRKVTTTALDVSLLVQRAEEGRAKAALGARGRLNQPLEVSRIIRPRSMEA